MQRDTFKPQQLIDFMEVKGQGLLQEIGEDNIRLYDTGESLTGSIRMLFRHLLIDRKLFDDSNPVYRAYTLQKESIIGRVARLAPDKAVKIEAILNLMDVYLEKTRKKMDALINTQSTQAKSEVHNDDQVKNPYLATSEEIQPSRPRANFSDTQSQEARRLHKKHSPAGAFPHVMIEPSPKPRGYRR